MSDYGSILNLGDGYEIHLGLNTDTDEAPHDVTLDVLDGGDSESAGCAMPPERARELAHRLLRLADAAEGQRQRCQEREGGGAQCSFVGPVDADHEHYVAGKDPQPARPAASNRRLTADGRSAPPAPVNANNGMSGDVDGLTPLERQCIAPDTLPNGGEPLPPSCMDGTCACPSAPDGADQHLPEQVDPTSGHEIDVVYLPTCTVCGKPVDNPDERNSSGYWITGSWRHL